MLDSQQLETKQQCTLIDPKLILSKNNSSMPWTWNLDLYRGCQLDCLYCKDNANHKQHAFLGHQILAKKTAPQLLEQLLSSPSWAGESIHFGGQSETFQPLDDQLQLTRKCLEIIDTYPNPIYITTQSLSILDHLDLLKKIASKTSVHINVTITTLDETLRERIEPNSATSEQRFKILERCKKIGCQTHLFLMPIIPFITDNGKNLEKIIRRAAKAKADSLLAWTLELPTPLIYSYYPFLKKFSDKAFTQTEELYTNANKMQIYRRNLFALVTNLMQKYEVNFPAKDKKYE